MSHLGWTISHLSEPQVGRISHLSKKKEEIVFIKNPLYLCGILTVFDDFCAV